MTTEPPLRIGYNLVNINSERFQREIVSGLDCLALSEPFPSKAGIDARVASLTTLVSGVCERVLIKRKLRASPVS